VEDVEMAAPVLPAEPLRHPHVSGPVGRRAVRTATAACHLLRRRGWRTGLAEFRIAGESDVRLLAESPGGGMTVELLCPCSETSDDVGPWAAARIGSDAHRTVWCGPSRGCSAETLARFVDDLARLPDGALGSRYRRCG
jgi:hypothetical protein